MYLGKKKIFNPEEYEHNRQRLLDIKSNAMWLAFTELDGLLNNSALARQYFKRSPGWLSQRVNGNKVFDRTAMFREAEYATLAEAFRDIARRLNAHADEIDAAAMDPDDIGLFRTSRHK